MVQTSGKSKIKTLVSFDQAFENNLCLQYTLKLAKDHKVLFKQLCEKFAHRFWDIPLGKLTKDSFRRLHIIKLQAT